MKSFIAAALIGAACMAAAPAVADTYVGKTYLLTLQGTVASGTDQADGAFNQTIFSPSNGQYGGQNFDLAGASFTATFKFDTRAFVPYSTEINGHLLGVEIDASTSLYSNDDLTLFYSDYNSNFLAGFASASLSINGVTAQIGGWGNELDQAGVWKSLDWPYSTGNDASAYVYGNQGRDFLTYGVNGDLFTSAWIDQSFIAHGGEARFSIMQERGGWDGFVNYAAAQGVLEVSTASWIAEPMFGEGGTPFNPLMPVDDPSTPGFDIPVIVTDPLAPIFVDPVYAVGYDYSVDPNGPLFTSVVVPDILPGGDSVFELLAGGASYILNAGDIFDLRTIAAGGLSSFGIRGIDISEAIDPNDPNGFVTGLTFSATGTPIVQMRAVTFDTEAAIPEPASWAMMIAGFAFAGSALRRSHNRRLSYT